MRSVSRRLAALGAIVALALVGSTVAGLTADPTAVDLVDALNGVFGKHAGMRAAHTKGFCVTGLFTPSPEAATFSKAPQFAKPVPIIGRFSLGGGNPEAPDNAKDNVRGLALRFDLGNGAASDLVMISAPVFFVKTPALFVEFLQTVGSGDKDKLSRYSPDEPVSEAEFVPIWLFRQG